MKILITIFLIIWAIYCFWGIHRNYSHYGIADWIIIIVFTIAPYVIVLLASGKIKFSFLARKKKSTIAQSTHKQIPIQEQTPNIIDEPDNDFCEAISNNKSNFFQKDKLPPNSDFIKTIFLHQFEKHPHKEDDSFPQYFYYEYRIINMPSYFYKVEEEGLICPSPLEDILGMMKMVELKDILSEHGLKKSGNKPDLIARIISNLDASKIPSATESYYSLSHNGKKFLSDHYDYIKLKQHPEWEISFWQYQNKKEESDGLIGFNDIILSLLNDNVLKIKKIQFEMEQFEYSKLKDLYISAYKILMVEKRYDLAMKALLKRFLLSLSGCKNNWLIKYKRELKLKNEQILINYAPIDIDAYIAASLCDLQEYYNEKISEEVFKEFIGPYNLCTYEMFCEVIELIFNSSILDLSKYDMIIKNLFIKKLK